MDSINHASIWRLASERGMTPRILYLGYACKWELFFCCIITLILFLRYLFFTFYCVFLQNHFLSSIHILTFFEISISYYSYRDIIYLFKIWNIILNIVGDDILVTCHCSRVPSHDLSVRPCGRCRSRSPLLCYAQRVPFISTLASTENFITYTLRRTGCRFLWEANESNLSLCGIRLEYCSDYTWKQCAEWIIKKTHMWTGDDS